MCIRDRFGTPKCRFREPTRPKNGVEGHQPVIESAASEVSAAEVAVSMAHDVFISSVSYTHLEEKTREKLSRFFTNSPQRLLSLATRSSDPFISSFLGELAAFLSIQRLTSFE